MTLLHHLPRKMVSIPSEVHFQIHPCPYFSLLPPNYCSLFSSGPNLSLSPGSIPLALNKNNKGNKNIKHHHMQTTPWLSSYLSKLNIKKKTYQFSLRLPFFPQTTTIWFLMPPLDFSGPRTSQTPANSVSFFRREILGFVRFSKVALVPQKLRTSTLGMLKAILQMR